MCRTPYKILGRGLVHRDGLRKVTEENGHVSTRGRLLNVEVCFAIVELHSRVTKSRVHEYGEKVMGRVVRWFKVK